jgi:NAD(P)H-hydrate epimerase
MIGGLMAQGINSIDASVAGVYLHSMAGVIAREHLGSSTSVTALNILKGVPHAFAEMKKAH